MSVQITIKNTPIDFPSSAQSPNWAPAIIEFAQVAADAINEAVGQANISPQVIDIINDNTTHDITTPSGVSLSFSNSLVRTANVQYSIYRNNSLNQLHVESGSITVVYNGTSWILQRDYTGTIFQEGINITIDSSGQMQYTIPSGSQYTVTTGYVGKFSFAAQALSQSS